MLLAALAVGALLRLWDLSGPSISHPEIYVPGIDLIAGLSEPPPRHSFLETLRWHFESEPHPEGWYMLMWAWTKIAGSGLFALRLPGVLFGIAGIWAIWQLGRRSFGVEVGALAALLLALNGFHIYWSQNARMYSPGAFFSLVATLALVELVRSNRRRLWLEAGYVAALIAGTQTVELFWAIIFVHMGWAALVLPARDSPRLVDVALPWRASVARPIQLQAIALALAVPELIHAAMLARHGAAPAPQPRFLLEYANYGFIFDSDEPAGNFASPVWPAALLVAISAIALAAMGLRRPSALPSESVASPLPFEAVALGAVAGAVFTEFMAFAAPRHHVVFAGFSLFALLSVWLPALASAVRPLGMRFIPGVFAWIDRRSPIPWLFLLLATLPPLLFYVASAKMSVLAPRAFLLFTPYLLLLVAAGLLALETAAIRALCFTAVALLSVAGCLYGFERPHGPRDYEAIAGIISSAQQPGDVVMIRGRNWADTPDFYYMPHERYVTEQQIAKLGPHWPHRIWMLDWTNDPRPYGFGQLAADHYTRKAETPVLGGDVELFVRPGA